MKFSKEDKQELREVPKDKKIQRIIFGFPKDKLSEGYGITYDFLWETWDFVGVDWVLRWYKHF